MRPGAYISGHGGSRHSRFTAPLGTFDDRTTPPRAPPHGTAARAAVCSRRAPRTTPRCEARLLGRLKERLCPAHDIQFFFRRGRPAHAQLVETRRLLVVTTSSSSGAAAPRHAIDDGDTTVATYPRSRASSPRRHRYPKVTSGQLNNAAPPPFSRCAIHRISRASLLALVSMLE
jgi:hypothetical protein